MHCFRVSKFPRVIRCRINTLFSLLLAAGHIALLSTRAPADVFHYDDFSGSSLQFENVFEVGAGDGPVFGQPSAPADVLNIPVTGFQITAQDGFDFSQGLIELTVSTTDGSLIDSFRINEFGSFALLGSQTSVLLNSSAFAVVDGEVFAANAQQSFAPDSSGSWQQTLEVFFPKTDEFRLVFDSQMFGTAGLGETAFINKAGSSVSFGSVTAAPEPSHGLAISTILFGGLLFCRRRQLATNEVAKSAD